MTAIADDFPAINRRMREIKQNRRPGTGKLQSGTEVRERGSEIKAQQPPYPTDQSVGRRAFYTPSGAVWIEN